MNGIRVKDRYATTENNANTETIVWVQRSAALGTFTHSIRDLCDQRAIYFTSHSITQFLRRL